MEQHEKDMQLIALISGQLGEDIRLLNAPQKMLSISVKKKTMKG